MVQFPSERVEAWARFDAFFQEQHERLFKALYFVTGSRHDAEELMQDAFLRLWERWDAIETIDAQTGDDRPAFYGINCSHPLEFIPAIESGSWFERVRCLRPNAAMMDKASLCTIGHLEEGDPRPRW